MLGLQTLACLQDIPVVRSSTNKIHDVYAKAKDTSVLIRLPCSVAETIADKSFRVALTIANPFVKPFHGPVRVIDDFAAQKIRQIESKYPSINKSPDEVLHTFNEKTEPVRHAINSVKDTTTSTIQHGKDTVSHVATATVNKASDVADSVFSFCESRVPGMHRRDMHKSTSMVGRLFSMIGSLYDAMFQSVHSSLIWFRMLLVFFLLKIKQINDIVLHKIQHKSLFMDLPQRCLIIAGTFLDYFIGRIQPDDRTLTELKKTKQQSRLSRPSVHHQQQHHHQQQQHQQQQNHHHQQQQQQQSVVQRPTYKPTPPVTTRQSVVVTQQETVVTRTSNTNAAPKPQPDYSNMTDKEELYARLAANDTHVSAYHVDDHIYRTEPTEMESNPDIAQLHAYVKPTDVELLYSRLPADVLPETDNQEPLTHDQQTLHAKVIAAELDRQGFHDGQ